jgi:hypothetical protein
VSRAIVRTASAWRVAIPEHSIARRSIGGTSLDGVHHVDACTSVQFEQSRRSAIATAVRAAHARAGVPAWLPYLRETARLARVERCVVEL